MPRRQLPDGCAPAADKARQVLQALAEVVQEAQKRGLPLDAAFVHFDRRDQGVVSVEELLHAVVELRLCPTGASGGLWGQQDAEECVAALSRGKSRSYFTRDDFLRFFSASPSPPKAPELENRQTAKQERAAAPRLKQTSPGKAERRLQHRQQQATAAEAHTLRQSPTRSTKPLQVSLPEWAHARSKRALKELETRRRRRPASQPPLSLSSMPHFHSASSLSSESPLSHRSNNESAQPAGALPVEVVPQLDLSKKKTARSGSTQPVESADDLLEFPLAERWKSFQLDADTAISYGILSHDPTASTPRKDSEEPTTAADATAEERAANQATPFRLTVFLDAFQRLETLESFFQSLLLRFPRGKVLLCGFPTRSKRGVTWHNARFAAAYGRLLTHLAATSREWLVQPKLGVGAVPQYLVGFGTGGSAALQLLGMELPLREAGDGVLGLFARSLRGVVLVNALASVTDVERRVLHSLQRLLDASGSVASTGDAVELHEALAAALFSEHYLAQGAASRPAALETFFRTRRGFLQSTRSSTAASATSSTGDGELLRLLLRGAAKSRDVSAAVANLAAVVAAPFALVVVHGSQNALFTPRQVALLTGDSTAASSSGFSTASSIADSLVLSNASSTDDEGVRRLHVAWLKGGHELLQERASFFYDLFRQLVTAAVTHPEPEEAGEAAKSSALPVNPHQSTDLSSARLPPSPLLGQTPRSEDEDAFAWDESLPPNRHGSQLPAFQPASQPRPDLRGRVAELLAMRGLPWIQQELYDRGLEGSGPTAVILERFERVLQDEDQAARLQQRETQRRHAQHVEVEAQRRAKEQEALERELRADEAKRAIQRREREEQQQFFERMEAQKLANARSLQERELMTLEDFRSRKVEDQRASAVECLTRNEAMARQVSELAAEREEQARREVQVALQERRLEEQKQQREALKAFQRAFEQEELVSSPVEAYWLDAPALYERFDDVASGARVLAADLVHLYSIKALQKRESNERRLELETLRLSPLAAKELEVRNLERVHAKAQSTGMIAKAGLGTVRIVPITAAELQALGRELDTARDELARLQSDVLLRQHELDWKDQLLQRLSVLLQRNERFREELLDKLAVCADLGNERVLSLREDGEALEIKREALVALRGKLMRRKTAVEAESARARAADTVFFDTSLRVEGAVQRVQRSVLLKELAAETETLNVRIEALDQQDETAQQSLERSKATLEEVANRTVTIEESQKALELATEARNRDVSESNDDLAAGEGTGHHRPKPDEDLAELVRLKKHEDRSTEEKRWVGLDFLVNFAHYYKHVTPEEVELIQKNGDYRFQSDLTLTAEHVQRLTLLPARNCLAFAFFKSREEMEIHHLLRKFTFGDGEEHLAQQDDAFELSEDVAPPHAAVSSSLEAVLSTLEQLPASSSSPNPQHPRARLVVLDEKAPPLTLLHVPQSQLFPHKSVTHSFRLPKDADGVAVLSLTVSVVFQGHFKSVGYQNGRLAAMLYVLPPATDPFSSSEPLQQTFRAPVPIGKCFHTDDLALCSPHSMGKLVLRHEPLAVPLSAAATYQLVLGAPVFTAYSVEVRGRTALFADEALRRKRVDALKKQELLPRKQDELQNVFVTIQLSERKKRLAQRLARDAKDHARAAELELLRHTKQLEADDVEPLLSHEDRRALHAAIHTANAAFTQSCFLFSKREEEVRDIEQSLKELTRIHVDVLDECESMERQLDDYRSHLPPIAAALGSSDDGEVAAAKLARELNVEYVSKAGTKSSKARWAELSAMKAKLPSMMTLAERLRRKYKKARDPLEKKEREWVLLDRILNPRLYRWEQDKHGSASDGGYANAPGVRLKLHGAYPKLSKDEEQLAALSQMELERIVKAPWNLLERKEIQIRKIVTRYRDEHDANAKRNAGLNSSPATMAALLRVQSVTELTLEEREWRLFDQLLNPIYYPVNFKRLAKELASTTSVSGGLQDVRIPSSITREDLVTALNTPEQELFQLSSDLLRARSLLLRYDPQLSVNLVEAARIQQHRQHQETRTDVVEMDVDARCRLVFQELQRAIANTRNEFMDSYVLHSTLQRFPTKVLRLELEKDLDRLLVSQITEKEDFELANFLSGKPAPLETVEDVVSDSDSDEEAQIVRELETRRKAKEDAKRGPKVRGKALKHKSLQKQRREIKDALQGRSLEQQRLLLREQELGVGGCMACRTNPCEWKPFLEESHVTIQDRMGVIQDELERVKRCPDLAIASSVCMAAVKSGSHAVTLRKSDLFDELTLELKIWDKNLRLKAVDQEFHETFRSKNEFFETQALHGFRQIQHKDKVQVALQREHNLLVAHLTAYEVVEDVLESMLEGWAFGERESDRQVLGFVPSLKREGPLTMQDLRRFEQDRRILQVRQDIRQEQLQNAQGLPSDKWQPIEVDAFQVNRSKKAVQKGSDMDKSLTETENALKFGLFCMTLMYFRGLALLKKQKTVWSLSAVKQRVAEQTSKSAERLRMDKEKRNVELRGRKAALYDEKARNGQARKQKFHEQKTAAYRRRLVAENRKAKRERRAAIDIQRMYRGHLGKLAGKKWMLRRREIDAQRALDHAAAITMQRAYRGRLGRLAAEEKRVELAEFISQIRAEEAIEEEEEYWSTHRVERVARKVTAFVKKQA
ncbi:hypothetical protein BBJ28_00015214 [Nothophytophthora sp. Chile5]|nr:hypothetical protein BBJ28_00015214 [Nothophytophthora sp. Chile5]